MVRQPGGETLFRKQSEREGGRESGAAMQQRQSLPPSSFFCTFHLPFSRVPRLLEVFSSFCFERADSFFGGRARGGKKEETLRRGDGRISGINSPLPLVGVERISLNSEQKCSTWATVSKKTKATTTGRYDDQPDSKLHPLHLLM